MTQSDSQKVIDAVMKGIAVFSNLDATEIGIDDNLEEDLFLNLETDLPAIISNIAKELSVEIPSESIAEFKKQVLADPEEASVASMVAMIEEEVEFN